MIIIFSVNFKFDHLFVMCTRTMRDVVVVELGAGWVVGRFILFFLQRGWALWLERSVWKLVGKRPLLSEFSLPPPFVFVCGGNPKACLV